MGLLCVLGLGFLVALVFLPAGRIDWFEGWIYVALLFAGWAVSITTISLKNPELLARRMKVGKGTKGWDRLILVLLRLTSFAIFILAGIDSGRFGWSEVPWWSFGLGVFLHVLGYAIVTWAMISNTHFEGTVRIQEDRDHSVVDQGPYRLIRHPGYTGFSFLMLAVPFLLRSWWALIPALATIVVIFVRTVLEDKTLKRELDGYADYANRVKFRLIPGLW